MNPRYKFNVKRKFRKITPEELKRLLDLSDRITYGGNPEHKMNPGDFGLIPPSSPRQGKSLCDVAAIFKKQEALELLKTGMRCGLVSDHEENGWPKNIWAVVERDNLIPLEAQLENSATGCYHGYPLLKNDPFYEEVLERWRKCHG